MREELEEWINKDHGVRMRVNNPFNDVPPDRFLIIGINNSGVVHQWGIDLIALELDSNNWRSIIAFAMRELRSEIRHYKYRHLIA